jgi:hypothetical protein
LVVEFESRNNFKSFDWVLDREINANKDFLPKRNLSTTGKYKKYRTLKNMPEK